MTAPGPAARPLTSELELVLWLEAQDLLHLRHGPPRRGRRRGRGAAAGAAGRRGGGRGRGARRVYGTHTRRHARPRRTHARRHARCRGPAPALARGSGGERETARARSFPAHCAGTAGAAGAELPQQGAWPRTAWEEGQSLARLFS